MTPMKWECGEDISGTYELYGRDECGTCDVIVKCFLESYRDEILRLLTEAPAKIERLRVALRPFAEIEQEGTNRLNSVVYDEYWPEIHAARKALGMEEPR